MIRPLFILDGPQYHQFEPGVLQRFHGVALALGDDSLTSIEIFDGERKLADAKMNLPSPELAELPARGTDRCRFECDMVTAADGKYEFRARLASGSTVPLFFYDPVGNGAAKMMELAHRVLALPVPSPETVAVTQGGGNVGSYAHSCVSGFFALQALLREAGIAPRSIGRVLDIGCGTGRLLLGWHVDDPRRRVVGADINAELIGWAQRELPTVAEWLVCGVEPPTEFQPSSFDLVQLTSVFTHLPLPLQHAWLGELRRLLMPGGVLVITLHGEPYVNLLLNETAREAFDRAGGYAEFAGAEPGANAFSTFHSPAFARRLFGGYFENVRFFPRGDHPTRPTLFPFAALQDVYILS